MAWSAVASVRTPGVFVTSTRARAARVEVEVVHADAVRRDVPHRRERVEERGRPRGRCRSGRGPSRRAPPRRAARGAARSGAPPRTSSDGRSGSRSCPGSARTRYMIGFIASSSSVAGGALPPRRRPGAGRGSRYASPSHFARSTSRQRSEQNGADRFSGRGGDGLSADRARGGAGHAPDLPRRRRARTVGGCRSARRAGRREERADRLLELPLPRRAPSKTRRTFPSASSR